METMDSIIEEIRSVEPNIKVRFISKAIGGGVSAILAIDFPEDENTRVAGESYISAWLKVEWDITWVMEKQVEKILNNE